MIGLDTGVLLRLFERGEPVLSAAADRLVAQEGSKGNCLIHPLVLVEIAWTLERAFKFDRVAIANYLDRIVRAPEFTIPGVQAARTAVERFRDGQAGFSDCLLAELNFEAGCNTTATFDVCAAKSAGFTLLTG